MLSLKLQLLEHLRKPGPGKIQISKRFQVYLPRATMVSLETACTIEPGKYDTQRLIRDALVNIYGKNIKNYSAKGKRGNRPGIHHDVYGALIGITYISILCDFIHSNSITYIYIVNISCWQIGYFYYQGLILQS